MDLCSVSLTWVRKKWSEEWELCSKDTSNKCDVSTFLSENVDVKLIYQLAYRAYEKDRFDSAYRLAELAAEYNYPRAIHLIGTLYDPSLKGVGSRKNPRLALEWYEKGSELGWASSQLNAARFYKQGEIVDKDLGRYHELILASANGGNVNATYLLGESYERGVGVPIDLGMALKYYKEAAKYGDADALYNVAVFYTRGRSVPVDYCKAVHYYTRAAEQNHAPAQHNLANRYGQGQCVEKDEEKAIELLRQAADQGYDLSINVLKAMGEM